MFEQETPVHRLTVRFVGSGSEYFRIWAVNLLLILVTLGIYYPFAKVRKLRYFHGATEVGGHALSFHANPWAMLRGYALLAVLVLVYSVAGQVSALAGGVAFLIVAAIWPALWHSSLRFRLANTGWRGLRFRFLGQRSGAYKVMLSWLGGILLLFAVGIAVAPEPGAPRSGEAGPGEMVLALLPLLLALFIPALLWLIRRYQHENYALGTEQTGFSVPMRSFYALFAKGALMALGVAVVLGALLAVVVPAIAGGNPRKLGPGAIVPIVLLVGLAYAVMLALAGAFVTARMQNLVWNGTRTERISFDSQLHVRPLAWLSAKNWVLIVLTLGLYFPFATVAVARMRLEAVTVACVGSPDELVAVATHADESAAGDAAGDLFGIDFGL